jgi:hypothetical protein
MRTLLVAFCTLVALYTLAALCYVLGEMLVFGLAL